MTLEALKEEFRNMIEEWNITPENKTFFKGQAIALLGMKYEGRPKQAEKILGEIVDAVIQEKLSKTKKNISMEDAVRSGITTVNKTQVAKIDHEEENALETNKENEVTHE